MSDGVSPNPLPAGGSVTSPITLPNTDRERTYCLDGLGNWRRTLYTPVGGLETTEIRQHNSLNQITEIQVGSTVTPFSYDLNGNTLADGERLYAWDALNRLIEVKRKSDDDTIGEYAYDALNRRIRKTILNGGLSGNIPNGSTDFLYNSIWQCLEERNASDEPIMQYCWGVYIDELLQQTPFTGGEAQSPQHPLQDLLYRTMALTDEAASIVEVYDYDAYGNTLIFTAAGTAGDWWDKDAVQGDNSACLALFTGRQYDIETGLYQYRMRYYSPIAGRFVSADALFGKDYGNEYSYAGGRPSIAKDAIGLEPDLERDYSYLRDAFPNEFAEMRREYKWRTFIHSVLQIGVDHYNSQNSPYTYVPGVFGGAYHLNDSYFGDSPYNPCVVCHGVCAWGVVAPPNSFRLLGGVGSLEFYQSLRDTSAIAGAMLLGGAAAYQLGVPIAGYAASLKAYSRFYRWFWFSRLLKNAFVAFFKLAASCSRLANSRRSSRIGNRILAIPISPLTSSTGC